MLKSLKINNVVLIDKAEINLFSGLCVLTGETGSGKSILLDALGLAIGFRSNSRLVGNIDNKALVSAEFEISNNQPCQKILGENDLFDGENKSILRIRRTISENTGSKVFVNDVAIGVNLLARIGETLVEIHGQHEQHGLLNSSAHLSILDEFSGNQNLIKNLRKTYENLTEIDKKIADFFAKKEQIAREKDYLEYIITELESANIYENEEQDLTTKKDQLIAKEKILNFLSDLRNQLTDANSNLLNSQKILTRNYNLIENYLIDQKDSFDNLNEITEKQINEIDIFVSQLERTSKEIKSNNDDRDEIEERLFFIRSLARKFNTQISQLPQIINDSREKLALINNDEKISQSLVTERENLIKEYVKIASELSQKRKLNAEILANKVEDELQFLKMAGTKFRVEIIPNSSSEIKNNLEIQNNESESSSKSDDYFLNGYEKVRFTASINQNSFDEITKIASGGELSRFMLALKVALMDVKSVPTIIFDEIDTGISGSTADAVGKRLKTLSKSSQILVVTHQPQIASKADHHLKIRKSSEENKVKTIIEALDKSSTINEIARMLSGEKISEEAISAAKSLMT